MLYLLISCVSFILVSKSMTNKQPWQEGQLKLFSIGLSTLLMNWFQKSRLHTGLLQPISFRVKHMVMKSSGSREVLENVDQEQPGGHVCLLDLPDLTMECILEKLSPSGLCSMAGVCTSMRDRCIRDHFWEKHMKQKWGKLIGAAAYREWELQHTDSARRRNNQSDQTKKKSVFDSLSGLLQFCSWVIRPKLQSCRVKTTSATTLPVDSVMSLYLSLEIGDFWFPAQVYNRENGNVGFMLSCYDAQLRYDSGSDTFQARYSPYGRRTMEENIPWDRIRAAPVDTPSHMLHVSDCLHDLKPGDHIEIQWRRSKEFPYGWWYGVIGHFELCNGSENHCHCHYNDTVVLEFSQYTPGSRWRQMMINRKYHREEGNEADGFYGGIRKLYNVEEIAKWKLLWPNQVLE
ncbi:PREDICTED: F-box protein At2g32560-like [Fragaria vesca subsp. vesca]|uniref:F-box protein At2g32560-like n=1 Tax=Fragaria vesca subsp. vesca TaxID=101020 RepID=UPI0002C2F237|nr:PREDICTED: F-box protein At2g32560-like [Fragaria vesca subsp. vesca]